MASPSDAEIAWQVPLLACTALDIRRRCESASDGCRRPLNQRFVISSLVGRYATQQAANTWPCSEGTGSSTITGSSLSSLLTMAATPPVTVSTQSMPASAMAAEATVIQPLNTFIISQLSIPWSWAACRVSSPSMIVTITSTPLLGHRSAIRVPRSAVSRCVLRSRSLESRR